MSKFKVGDEVRIKYSNISEFDKNGIWEIVRISNGEIECKQEPVFGQPIYYTTRDEYNLELEGKPSMGVSPSYTTHKVTRAKDGTWDLGPLWGDEEVKIEEDKARCCHPNKKLVQLIYSSYMYCPDCKTDLGDAK